MVEIQRSEFWGSGVGILGSGFWGWGSGVLGSGFWGSWVGGSEVGGIKFLFAHYHALIPIRICTIGYMIGKN